MKERHGNRNRMSLRDMEHCGAGRKLTEQDSDSRKVSCSERGKSVCDGFIEYTPNMAALESGTTRSHANGLLVSFCLSF